MSELSERTRRTASTVGDAYAACEQIARDQAKNFWLGIRLLPQPKRSALYALYGLARRIDDIADGDLPPGTKTKALTTLSGRLTDPTGGDDPVLLAVADAARRYPVPLKAFSEMINAAQQDVDGVHIGDIDDLTRYCHSVAGTVGQLCLAIFGSEAEAAPLWADQLGCALQQTNILRDLREDLLRGRVYLPDYELARFDVRLELDACGALADPDGRLAALITHAADRAEHWYCLGWRLMEELDSRSAACCATMAATYRALNDRIRENPVRVYDQRLSLTSIEKTRIASGTFLRYSAAGLASQIRSRRHAILTASDPDRTVGTPTAKTSPSRSIP